MVMDMQKKQARPCSARIDTCTRTIWDPCNI